VGSGQWAAGSKNKKRFAFIADCPHCLLPTAFAFSPDESDNCSPYFEQH
jgi:hypothetical protein